MIARFKNALFSGEKSSTSITEAAFVIAAMGMASRLLGLFRDRIFATQFGAGDVLDAYYAAFKIPDLVYNLLVLGALSAAFVPVFTSLMCKQQREDAWKLANNVISMGLVILSLIVVVIFIFAPGLVRLITFGFDGDKQELVVELTRIMLLSPIILGVSGIIGGVLNSFKKFFFYSLAPIFYNLGIIIGALVFAPWWGPEGLAVGVVLGALLHLLIQLPEVFRCGFKFSFDFGRSDSNLRKIGRLMLPRTMGLAVAQVNLLIVTILASTLASGSLAIFNFANNLQSVPLGIFGISFAIASFPTLSSLWAEDKKEEFAANFSRIAKRILFFVIPISVIFIILRAQIVRVVLGAGEFGWEETILTFQALGIFSVSLFAQCLIPLLARSFYAIHDTKTPFYTGIFSEVINIGLALYLIEKMGILGLIWAVTVSSIVNMLILFVFLNKKTGAFSDWRSFEGLGKIVMASAVMAITTQAAKKFLGDALTLEVFVGIFTQLVVSLLVAGVTFLIFGKLFKIEELDHFIAVLKRKVFRIQPQFEDERDEIAGI